ncbi:transforming growth factor-beta receptor-associated protein 1 isoform X2 [Genypterus blacodes]|uniref:transforming growth factor-beta receptor-associated protein 1 isoform X2 n=1 Tax=Genypterus blacodes TaxID=154954 RepID=UPI003F76D96A
MAFNAFTQAHLYEKQAAPKEKDKCSIQCLECYDQNLYIGSRDATVQHIILHSRENGALKRKEGRMRKLGSGGPVTQMRAVPVFNHLLVLWDRSVSALNMFSLEPVPALKKIQHVSLFDVRESSGSACVEMVTSSSRRKMIRIHVVGVDRWEVVKEVSMPQEPVALAADGGSLCMASSDRYLICDIGTGSCMELFPHSLSRQCVIVASVGGGEFLLNGPGSLGMFVMKTGICQRPPLQWPREVLAARACFPYILTLQATTLSVYSMLDQQCKQTMSLSGGKGLISTSDGVLVFTERDIFSLTLVPLQDQIQALVGHQRVEEALLLLDGVQSHFPLDSYKELQKIISRQAGYVYFYQEVFSEAKDLFIKGELDPREIISLYPDMESCLGENFQSQLDRASRGRDLRALRQEDRNTFHRYLDFLGDFLRAFSRGKEQSVGCRKEVDCALLRLYAELGDVDKLQQLLAFPNGCRLDDSVPVLQQHNRFFALGSLYLCHGKHTEAIKTWVKIADGHLEDVSCSDVYGHIVWTLSQMKDNDAVRTFADWALQRNQEIGVQIFTKRPPEDQAMFVTQDVLALLKKYPLASRLYLEFLIQDLESEEELHHNLLVLAYVTQVLQKEKGTDSDTKTRGKLQQLLWDSIFYDVFTVYERVEPTTLHMEKAILLGRAGEHTQALQVLVYQEQDLHAAEAFCCRSGQRCSGSAQKPPAGLPDREGHPAPA